MLCLNFLFRLSKNGIKPTGYPYYSSVEKQQFLLGMGVVGEKEEPWGDCPIVQCPVPQNRSIRSLRIPG